MNEPLSLQPNAPNNRDNHADDCNGRAAGCPFYSKQAITIPVPAHSLAEISGRLAGISGRLAEISGRLAKSSGGGSEKLRDYAGNKNRLRRQ